MKVYHSINEFKGCPNAVVTLGTFDGLHMGHLKIIQQLKDISKEIKGESVVITFDPHPRLVLFGLDTDLRLLSTLEEKIKLFEKTGIDHLIVHPFTKEFSRLTTTEFVRDLLINKIGTRQLVIGYDHRLGRNREGSLEQLKELETVFDFTVVEIPKQEIDNVAISSTKIRNALLNGNIEIANSYLGYYYSVSGKVIHGDKLGSQIGFPTANLQIEDRFKLVPGNGVYLVKVILNNASYNGMMNIGFRPTLEGKIRRAEVNIFNFSQDIYNQTLTVQFIKKLRDERKFPSLEHLKRQLFEDRELAMEILFTNEG